ncbi:Chitotriosidase-1 [Halotydeus destructor]|nr:Chitotriosidase-1 [Halotydeus destructor]
MPFISIYVILTLSFGDLLGAKLICLTEYFSAFSSKLHDGFKCDMTIDCCSFINPTGIRHGSNVVPRYKLLEAVQQQRTANPAVKILLGIGSLQRSSTISQSLSTSSSRRAVIASTQKHIENLGYDGVYINWQYPTMGDWGYYGNQSQDKDYLSNFLLEMRSHLGPNVTIGLLLGTHPSFPAQKMYDCNTIDKTVDFVSVLTRVIYGTLYKRLSHFTPLYDLRGKILAPKLNVNRTVNRWLACSVSPSKIFFDIVPAVIIQRAEGSPRLLAKATEQYAYPYHLVCPNQLGPEYNITWIDGWDVPVAFNATYWIGFENERSLAAKVGFMFDKQLAGMTFKGVVYDDVSNSCGQGIFPVLSTLSQLIHKPADSDIFWPKWTAVCVVVVVTLVAFAVIWRKIKTRDREISIEPIYEEVLYAPPLPP